MLLLTRWKSAKHVKTHDWVSDKRFPSVLMCFSFVMSVLKGFYTYALLNKRVEKD